MKKIIIFSILIGPLIFFSSTPAQALSLSYSVTTSPLATAKDPAAVNSASGFSNYFGIQQFDSALGTLTSIDISMTATALVDYHFVNGSGSQLSFVGQSMGAFTLQLDGGSYQELITVNRSAFGGTWATTPTTVVAANSDRYLLNTSSSDTGMLNNITDAGLLAYFTGGGTAFLAGYTPGFATGGFAFGGSNWTVSALGWAQEQVNITYNYDEAPPVPEPGTMMLLGSGLMMFGGRAVSRFRRNKV